MTKSPEVLARDEPFPANEPKKSSGIDAVAFFRQTIGDMIDRAIAVPPQLSELLDVKQRTADIERVFSGLPVKIFADPSTGKIIEVEGASEDQNQSETPSNCIPVDIIVAIDPNSPQEGSFVSEIIGLEGLNRAAHDELYGTIASYNLPDQD